jgi:Tfp pilus assembly protein FimT
MRVKDVFPYSPQRIALRAPAADPREGERRRRHRRPRRASAPARAAGVSLGELVIAFGIAALLAAIAASSLARTLTALRLPLAASQLAADLHVARGTAVRRNTRALVTFAARAYTVAYDRGEPAAVTMRLPEGIRVTSLPRSGVLRFFPAGNADNATVVLESATGAARSVVVNQRGRISIR